MAVASWEDEAWAWLPRAKLLILNSWEDGLYSQARLMVEFQHNALEHQQNHQAYQEGMVVEVLHKFLMHFSETH